MPEQILANGVPLNSAWCQVEDVTNLLATAARRGSNVVVPGRHGVIRTPRKRYTTADLVIPMHVKGVDRATGIMPADPVTQLHENVDELLRLFHAETVRLEYVRGNGSSRSADTELIGEPVVVTRERSYPPLARVAVPLTVFGAFWEDTDAVSQTVTGATGVEQALTAFAGATAPMAELVLTFFGPINNPMLSHGDRWVKYNGVVSAGRQLVLNTGTWQVSSGSGAAWSPDPRQVEQGVSGPWFELEPAVSPFSVVLTHTGGGSATATVAGRRRYLTP